MSIPNRGVEFFQGIPLSDLPSSVPVSDLEEGEEKKTKRIRKQILNPSKVAQELNSTEVTLLSSNKIETLLRSVQYYINDLVLQGTCEAIRFSHPSVTDRAIPFLDSARDLDSAIRIADDLELALNLLDIGLGIPNLIQRSRILARSQEALKELREKEKTLSPDQQKRLQNLENFVNYQKSLLPYLMTEQGLRISRSTLTIASPFVSNTVPLHLPLMAPLNLLIGGINTAISGLFLAQALDHCQLQDGWVEKSPAVFLPLLLQKEQMIELQKKRGAHREKMREQLINQSKTQPLSEAQIEAKLEEQTTIDPILKGSVVEMVKKKHEIERKFLNFKVAQYGTSFALSALTVVTGVALLLALLVTPVGPAATILLFLNIFSIASGAAFFAAGNVLAYQYRPALTVATFKGAYIKLIFYYAMHYLQTAKDSIASYFKRDALMTKELTKSASWLEKAHELQEELDQIAWQDFAHQAHLTDPKEKTTEKGESLIKAWDTLEALNEALNRCDFNLLRPETREILEKQLGLDFSSIEEERAKDPLIVKKMLRNFFNLGNTAFVEFMGKQKGTIS